MLLKINLTKGLKYAIPLNSFSGTTEAFYSIICTLRYLIFIMAPFFICAFSKGGNLWVQIYSGARI